MKNFPPGVLPANEEVKAVCPDIKSVFCRGRVPPGFNKSGSRRGLHNCAQHII